MLLDLAKAFYELVKLEREINADNARIFEEKQRVIADKEARSPVKGFIEGANYDYKKIRLNAELILDSASATKEQRQQANFWMDKLNRYDKK